MVLNRRRHILKLKHTHLKFQYLNIQEQIHRFQEQNSSYTNENCADNTEVKLKKVDDNNYRYSESEGVLLESPTSGIFNINGLQAGTYYLKEVEAPVGYNKLNEPIKITVQLDGAKK